MTGINGKVVVITGASSGIGEAAATALAADGAKVVLGARRQDRLDALVGQITDAGGQAVAVACDVADRAQVKALIDAATEHFGRIDVLINNAGIMPLAPIAACRMDDWDDCIDVNIKGLLYGIGYVLPIMQQQKTGQIINVSSVAGRKLFPGAAVYCGTKHAVHAISEGLRNELAVQGEKDGSRIRVTVIAPGAVLTELHHSIRDEKTREASTEFYENLPGVLTSEDIAASIVYAVGAPEHVNVNEILIRPTSQTL